MEVMYRDQHADAVARRPSWLDLWAAGLLTAAVVLHVVAMFPPYFGGSIGQGSVWSQSDQAALYAVVTAGWAIALALVLSGPGRIRLGAGVAVGLAITELGFRVGDVGEALQYGVAGSSTGVWLMTAGWAAGAAGAIVAVLAVRCRARVGLGDAAATGPAPAWDPAPEKMSAAAPPGPSPTSPSWIPQPDPRWAPPGAPQPPPDPRSAGPGTSAPPPDPRLAPPGAPQPPPDPRWVAPGAPQRPPDPGWAAPRQSPPRPALDQTPPNPWAPPSPASPAPAAAAGEVEAGDQGRGYSAPVEPTATLPVEVTAAVPVEPTTPFPVEGGAGPPEPTAPYWVGGPSGLPVDAATKAPAAETAPSGPYGAGLTWLVALLALITAGAFLPAWDRYVGVVTTTGRTVSFSLGNAFSGPWPLVLGNVLVALALVAVPVLGSRLRDRTVAASVVVGSLLVLASQFTAAIVQVNQPVPPSVAGLTPAQANQLALELHMSLTGWFTLDVLAAYGLFVAVMVIGYLRPAPVHENSAQANSAGTWSSTPEARSPASLPWS